MPGIAAAQGPPHRLYRRPTENYFIRGHKGVSQKPTSGADWLFGVQLPYCSALPSKKMRLITSKRAATPSPARFVSRLASGDKPRTLPPQKHPRCSQERLNSSVPSRLRTTTAWRCTSSRSSLGRAELFCKEEFVTFTCGAKRQLLGRHKCSSRGTPVPACRRE